MAARRDGTRHTTPKIKAETAPVARHDVTTRTSWRAPVVCRMTWRLGGSKRHVGERHLQLRLTVAAGFRKAWCIYFLGWWAMVRGREPKKIVRLTRNPVNRNSRRHLRMISVYNYWPFHLGWKCRASSCLLEVLQDMSRRHFEDMSRHVAETYWTKTLKFTKVATEHEWFHLSLIYTIQYENINYSTFTMRIKRDNLHGLFP